MSTQCFAFIFPQWVGHLNPSLPVARRLVELGHEVHYVCFQQMKGKIEGTGANFHSAVDCQPELYDGRGDDFISMLTHLQREFQLPDGKTVVALWQLQNVMIEKQLPGLVRLLQKIRPSAVMFCPLSSPEAFWASKVLEVPSIALNTFAGPGALAGAVGWCLKEEKVSFEELDQKMRQWQPNQVAVQRMAQRWGISLHAGMPPMLGYIDGVALSALTITTTSEDLQDPMGDELQRAYAQTKATLVAVGPLLDPAGSLKPAGDDAGIVESVLAARNEGRLVVLVSMGTVVTGNMPYWGWEGRQVDELGRSQGLSGCQLCRSVWAGAFDAFGSSSAEGGALIVVSLGPQADPLGDVIPPPNAICRPFLPQVDLLKAGVDVFLTHGGQNSFTESLVHNTPVVVCPGFSDQVVNASKAVALGVGLKVDRPTPADGQEELATVTYRRDVKNALLAVACSPTYKSAAEFYCKSLKAAGGVDRAVKLVQDVASASSPSTAKVGGA